MHTILLSGFEPFHLYKRNPSLEVAKALSGELLEHHFKIVHCTLPVVQHECFVRLKEVFVQHQPAAVVCLGQGSGKSIALERVAINIDDYRIKDNAGNQVEDMEIVEGAPAAHWSTLPIKRLKQRMEQEDISASISNSAGTFVCNHLFFQLQNFLHHTSIPSGFVHIPMLPEQNPKENMSIEDMLRGIRVLLSELALFVHQR